MGFPWLSEELIMNVWLGLSLTFVKTVHCNFRLTWPPLSSPRKRIAGIWYTVVQSTLRNGGYAVR